MTTAIREKEKSRKKIKKREIKSESSSPPPR